MDIKLIIEPSPGLQKFLDAVVASFGGKATAAPLKTVPAAAAAAAAAAKEKTDEKTATTETVTLEALRALVATKKSKRDGIKALLGTFGSPSISELAKEHYGAFHAELLKL